MKYILIEWPEIQNYMDSDRWKECYAAIRCDISVENGVWFVPEDLVKEINTPPDPEFIFDGQIFTRDFWEIKRGDLVCFSDNTDKVWTSYCIIAGEGYMPDVYENGECPGINCFIEGIKI